jgi:hypothetical protein
VVRTHLQSPAIRLNPAFVTNVPSSSTPLPSSLSVLIANSVITLPIGFVGVIIPLYTTFIPGIIALFHSGWYGINSLIPG